MNLPARDEANPSDVRPPDAQGDDAKPNDLMHGEDLDLSLLDELAEEFTQRVRRGEKPNLADYLDRAPHLSDQLQSLLETVVFLETTRRELNEVEESAHEWPLPESLGEYRLIRELGRGGMGIVCEAAKPSSQRRVAVKFLAHELHAQALARKRFMREATLAMTVQHHHVVGIESVGEERAIPYLVMELVEGPTLRDYLAVHHPVPVEQILSISEQMAHGLDAAHQHGVVHRDIKPANVLVCLRDATSPQVKITDFGLARAHEDVSLTRTGHVMGTPQNMSPEQVSGQVIDHRSDLFSLGTVLYEMVAGQPAFAGETIVSVVRQIADLSPPPLRKLRPEVPIWFVELIDCLLEKDPALRPPSAGDVCRWIQSQGEQRPAIAGRATVTSDSTEQNAQSLETHSRRSPSRPRLQTWALGLSLALIAIAAGAAIWSGVHSSGLGPSAQERPLSTAVAKPLSSVPPVTSSGNYAIQFDGIKTVVRVPRLVRTDGAPATLEAWVRSGPRSSAKIIALWGGPGRCQISVSQDNWFSCDDTVEGRYLDTPCHVASELSPWIHLAYVADEKEGRLYVQGKKVASGLRKPDRVAQFPNPPTWIGASPEPVVNATKTQYHFLGLIDELRFSRVARYQADFQPPTRWEADDQTIALYHFDEQSGHVLYDSSGNGFNGEITAARWVPAAR